MTLARTATPLSSRSQDGLCRSRIRGILCGKARLRRSSSTSKRSEPRPCSASFSCLVSCWRPYAWDVPFLKKVCTVNILRYLSALRARPRRGYFEGLISLSFSHGELPSVSVPGHRRSNSSSLTIRKRDSMSGSQVLRPSLSSG